MSTAVMSTSTVYEFGDLIYKMQGTYTEYKYNMAALSGNRRRHPCTDYVVSILMATQLLFHLRLVHSPMLSSSPASPLQCRERSNKQGTHPHIS
uniref:Uncharacterized protein n=1 Tax=Timema tahoe TaxID=61484 RepID=A0A7R9NXG7_9NEOP|nr:unnamed protein product [Timema tahoe]